MQAASHTAATDEVGLILFILLLRHVVDRRVDGTVTKCHVLLVLNLMLLRLLLWLMWRQWRHLDPSGGSIAT